MSNLESSLDAIIKLQDHIRAGCTQEEALYWLENIEETLRSEKADRSRVHGQLARGDQKANGA